MNPHGDLSPYRFSSEQKSDPEYPDQALNKSGISAVFVSLSIQFERIEAFRACSSAWLERTPDKREVGSSSLPRPTNFLGCAACLDEAKSFRTTGEVGGN